MYQHLQNYSSVCLNASAHIMKNEFGYRKNDRIVEITCLCFMCNYALQAKCNDET